MKKSLRSTLRRAAALTVAALGCWQAASAQSASDLFISEYVEGSGFNKYIEIYNGTGAAINLSDYQVRLYSNGSATVTASLNLSGTVNACDVVVLGNSSGTIFEEDIVANSVCNFNGDDAVALVKISTGAFVDIFGNIGCDPGTTWTGGSNVTADRSLRRACAVLGGVTTDPAGTSGTPLTCPFPTLSAEWTSSLGIDDASNLGVHDCACGTAPCSSGLFFSQYTEGSGFNKCVEIANYTGATVDLTGYQVLAYHNGSVTVSFTVNLTGSIADGDVFVVCNPSANAALLAVTDQTSSALQPNGDDALVLVAPGGAILDVFGQIGCDPGAEWVAGANSTADLTLTRLSSVTAGVTSNPAGTCGVASFATLGTEWFPSAMDVATGFGSHTISCGPAVAPSPELGADQLLCAGGSVTLDAGAGTSYLWSNGATTPTINVTTSGVYSVTVTNAAGSGSDRVAVIIKSPSVVGISGAGTICTGGTAALSATALAADLFISEYVEGSSNNKAVEIANFTGASVDLAAAGYSLEVSFNGGTSVVNFPLTGVVANGDVFVFASSAAVLPIVADQTTGAGLWNGDDAITLKRGTTVVDVFGVVGSDPGAQWGNPLLTENNTNDQTLRRGCGILSGINASPTASGASGFLTLQTEWVESSMDDFSGLGSHTVCPAYLWSTGATTASISEAISASTAYGVSVTSDNGCVNSAGFVVTVSQPQVSASDDATICAGSTTTLCSDVNSADLFFSEYVEGSGLNKCIEIYNNTGASVSLGTYTIEVSFNGGTSVISLPLSGTLADGDAYVLCDDGAAAEFLANADGTTTFSLWNGNDALVLKNGTTTVDIFGVVNNNPGTAWTSGANTTVDVTLRRVATVSQGVSVNPVGSFATLGSEWVSFPVNTADGLGSHTFTAGGSFSWSNGATTACTDVAPTTTTAYTVTYTDLNGCTATDVVTVNVNPLPVVSLGADLSICAGSSATLDAGNPGSTYAWSNGETTQTITVSTAGVYSVTVTSAAGCVSSDDVSVTVNPLPVVDAGDCKTVYTGYTSAVACASLTAGVTSGAAPYTYVWSNGATTASINVCPTGTTTYTVTVTDANGCTGTDDVTVNVIDASCGRGKVEVCHVPPGNPAAAHTICIAAPAVAAHLASGSYLGNCSEVDPCTSSKSAATSAEALEAGVKAYPNPFSAFTTVAYTLPVDGEVSISLFDLNGVKVADLLQGQAQGGVEHTLEVNAESLPAGVYFLQIVSGGTRMMEKLVLVK